MRDVISLLSADSMHLLVLTSHNTYGDRTYAKLASSTRNASPQNFRTACFDLIQKLKELFNPGSDLFLSQICFFTKNYGEELLKNHF